MARYLDREYSPGRLLYPLRRTGAKGEGRFARISWDEALDDIAARLQPSPASTAPKRYCRTATPAPWDCLTAAAWIAASSIAWARRGSTAPSAPPPAGAGLIDALGFRYGTEPEQFRHAKLIIAWGANILGTNVHLWPFIVEARRNGAQFYTIDPDRNRTGKLADKHFAIHPGSDVALALAMMHVIIGEKLDDARLRANVTPSASTT